MKNIFLIILINTIAIGNTFAECAYNLDASLEDIKNWQNSRNNTYPNYPRTFELIPNINQVEQKAIGPITYMTNRPIEQLRTSKKFANFMNQYPAMRVPDYLPFTDRIVNPAGLIVSEFIIDVTNLNIDMGEAQDSYSFSYSLVGSSEQKMELQLGIIYAKYNNSQIQENGDYIYISAGSFKSDGKGFVELKEIQQKNNKITPPTDGKVKVGIYINQSSKQIGYIINGTNYGYLNIHIEKPINSIGYLATINQTEKINSLLIGKNIGLQLITDHSKMQLTYPTGAKDICGNTL